MSTNIKNRLKFIFAGEILFTILFLVVALASPFPNKYNLTYWVSFGAVFLALATCTMVDFIAINSDNYNNDKCGNRVSLLSACYYVIQVALSIILMAINSESLQSWLTIVLSVAVFVVMTFIMVAAIITSPGNDVEEE